MQILSIFVYYGVGVVILLSKIGPSCLSVYMYMSNPSDKNFLSLNPIIKKYIFFSFRGGGGRLWGPYIESRCSKISEEEDLTIEQT